MTFAYTDADIWLNNMALTAVTNSVDLGLEAGTVDVSAFDSAWRKFTPGAKMANWSASGWWDVTNTGVTQEPDEVLNDSIDAPPTQQILTVVPTGTAGETAYLIVPIVESLQRGGQYGSAAEYSISGKADGAVYKGIVSLAQQTISGATNGSSVQWSGGVAATETVAMAVHVFVDNGTSLDVILESDDNAGFTSATTRATASVSGTTYTYLETATGAVSDDYWRVRTANLVGTSFILGASIGLATTS